MAYIGNLPATGQNNSFRLLDDITSYTLTFDGSSASVVNSSDKTIESANHRFVQGQRVVYAAGGGTPVANLTGGTAYFIIKQGGSHFQLATTADNASNGVAISISAAGSATGHTLIASFDAVNTRFMASHSGGTKVNITRSAQLNISINGVIQEPQETASPTAGFGRDSGSVIVFSTAPNAGDAFWGSLVADNLPTFDISDNDVDNFTGDDSTTDFTLSKTPPDARNILVTLDGVTQHPSDNTTTRAYTVTENILSFTSAPNTSVSIQVRHIGFAGATSGSAGVSAFYGRTGSVVLKNTDTINVANIVDEGYLAVGSTASFGGNVSIGGTLTYDDVTYVEAVGLSTFHQGINVIGVSTLSDSLRVGGHSTLTGTPHSYNYGRGAQDGGVSVYAREAAIEVVGDDDGSHGGSVLIRTPTEGFGFVINPSTNSLELKAFTSTGDNFTIHNIGQNVSSLITQLRVVKDEAVELYHNGSKKFESTGYGVTVVGAMQVSGMTTIFNQLTIQNANPILNFIDTNNDSDFRFQVEAGSFLIEDKSNNHADRFVLNSDGQVGIGTNPPQVKLHLHDTSNTRIQFTDASTGGASGDGVILGLNGDDDFFINNRESSKGIKFFTGSNTERMVIVSGGQVGFGITNPEDYFSSYNRVVMGRTNDTGGMTIVSSSTSGGYISFAKGTSGNQAYRGLIAYQHNGDYMTFNVDSTEKLRITGVGITVTGEVAASQDYPQFRPALDFNFAAEKKLDPRLSYQRTGPASYVNEFGKVVLVGDNQPRFDYGYEFLAGNTFKISREASKGILMEEERTNLFKQSIYESHFGRNQTSGNVNDWSLLFTGGGSASLTPGIDAPDGSNDAVRFTNNGTGFTILRLSIDAFTPNGSDTYALSFYVRSISGTGGMSCDLSDGAPQGTWSADLITNEWVRVVKTGVPTNSSKTFIDIMSNADNNRVFDIWGVQLEKGKFATSFIPTYGQNATRGNESLLLDGEDFTDFFNTKESTVVSQITPLYSSLGNHSGTGGVVWSFDAGGGFGNGSYFSNANSTSAFGNSVVVGSSGQNSGGGTGIVTSFAPFKNASAFKENDFRMATNGTLATADTSGTLPSVSKLVIGNNGWDVSSGLNGANAHINRFSYYEKRIPDNQLVTLTS